MPYNKKLGQAQYARLTTSLVSPEAIAQGVVTPKNVTLVLFFFLRVGQNSTVGPWLMPTPDVLKENRWLQVAHLLPLMQGTLNLPKLEERCRQWVERVRREALLDDDRVKARARLRDHTTAMRMTGCLILCAVAEKLIRQHGLSGAEAQLKMHPSLTEEMAQRCQTPAMLDAYEVLAESLIDNDMLFFREKLEGTSTTHFLSAADRAKRGKNDAVYDRLPDTFTFDQAMAAKGMGTSRNAVQQMLKNWRAQGLIILLPSRQYQKK